MAKAPAQGTVVPVRAADIEAAKSRLRGDIAQMIRDLPAERHLLADLLASLRSLDYVEPGLDEPRPETEGEAA
jgi:hypothetical protein